MSRMLTPKFLTKDIARYAVEYVLNSTVRNPRLHPFFKDGACHIVIAVPIMDMCGDWPIKPHVLYGHSEGDPKTWRHDFEDIAQCKAIQLWHGRNDGRTDIMPHLLFPGDTPWWGGVKRELIVVACSGFKPHIDRMISGMIADMAIGLAYDAWMKSADRAQKLDFLTT